jgi:hypothetical protein
MFVTLELRMDVRDDGQCAEDPNLLIIRTMLALGQQKPSNEDQLTTKQ